ncbi:carbohydrate-binding protein [Clostridium sp. CTA-5]
MKKFKKALSMLMSVCIFTGMLIISGFTQNVQAVETNQTNVVNNDVTKEDNPVELYYAKFEFIGYYAGSTHGYIRVKNLAYDKKVIVHYAENYGKSWQDKNAEYVKTNPDGSEIWRFNITTKYQGSEFAIKYEVNGKTYWDNNNGKNYSVGLTYHDVQLGRNNICVKLSSFSPDSEYEKLSAKICVRNTGKKPTNVKLRYSQDNWKTYKEVDAEPAQSYGNEVLDYIARTNDVDKTSKDIKYAVYAVIDGVEYCDDNFGSYYSEDVRY